MVRPALLCGRAPRASTFFLLRSSRGELLRSPSAAGVAWVPGVQTWTTFDGTRPYRTGKRCYMAVRRYTRCPANPADGLVKFRLNRGTTRRSASSNSSTSLFLFGANVRGTEYSMVVAHERNSRHG